MGVGQIWCVCVCVGVCVGVGGLVGLGGVWWGKGGQGFSSGGFIFFFFSRWRRVGRCWLLDSFRG